MSTTYLTQLVAYPVKSCAGVQVTTSSLWTTGLRWDRNWMLVDASGRFITQRTHPQLARIGCRINLTSLTMTSPGLPDLEIALDHTPSEQTTVSIWGEQYPAWDEGELAASWLAECLGGRHRLVRWNESVERRSDAVWTGADTALNRFSDGFPLLLIGEASLADLNARLPAPLPMNRFRPNLVVAGLEAYEEDYVDTLTAGNITLRVVKPCTRCEITTTDQITGARGVEPLLTLASYRADPRVGGGITFGQNVIVTSGIGETLHEGMRFEVTWRF